MSLLSQTIFKVNKLVGKNKIGQIYVFFGNNLDIEGEIQDPNELFKTEPNSAVFLDIFDKDELTNIQQNNIVPIFVKQSIHFDDTIGIIKLKIFEALGKNVSMDEMYLFCLKTEPISPITLYQNLTQNDRIPLTKLLIEQMTTNIYDKNTGIPIDFQLQGQLEKTELEKTEKYSFDDILRLNLLERDYVVASCLGQKFVFANEYPFIVDPYYVTDYDPLLERSRKELSSLNNNLLLETGKIFKNTINLCLAEDVLQAQNQNLNQDHSKDKRFTEYTIKIYYPFLYKANIESIDALEAARDGLVQTTSAKLSENMKRTFENIDLFYDIYRFLKKDITHDATKDIELLKAFSQNQKDTGITYIKVVLYPDFKINIPVDVIFKLLNSSQDSPLIKFNPETKQSNMLRLYTEQLTNDGRKIPFLSKTNIFKIIRVIGKHKSVSVYTTVSYQGIEYNIICEFEETGTITVYSLEPFVSPVLVNNYSQNRFVNIDTIIDSAVNPLIEKIRPFFEQSGLELPVFKSITSSNIEIRELTYQTIYSITKPIDLKGMSGCLSSVFTVESDDLIQNINMKDGASMRFKRVSNFTTLDSQVAFIIEKISKGFTQSEIVSDLIQQYQDMNDETANDVFAKTIRDLELVRGANKRRAIMVKINPGFKTVMLLNPITSEIKITMNGINNIWYLDTIPIYINSFIRITQDIDSTRVSSEDINRLCSGAAIEDVKIDDIVAQAEENVVENEVPLIQEDNSARYLSDSSGEAPDNDDLLELLGFDMGSDDNDLIGGANNSLIGGANNSLIGGAGPVKGQNIVQDITGMKLKYPNPFSKRIEDRMPNLFVKSKDDKIDLYTRMCPFNLAARRQPIILTPAEKDRLVNENPGGEYKENGVTKEAEFIEYGTDPNDASKKYYFTCPRFWCLKTNTAVTEAEIKAGKCGPAVENIEDAIIPKKADVVPKDRFVYRFYEDDEKNYPGFHKEKMPDGSCIPCCYSKWSTTEMKTRRDICQDKFKKGQNPEQSGQNQVEENVGVEEEMNRGIQESENYVKGPEKYPLGENRWGFLPISVQIFLNEVNAECKVSKVNMSLKPNQSCLLRRGVENNSSQSFIACIASAMFHEKEAENAKLNPDIPVVKRGRKKASNVEKKAQVPSIKEMKDLIISAIDIDKFITYQNGDLITSFANPTAETEQNVKASNIVSEMDTSPTSPVSPTSPRPSENYKFKSGERVKCNYKGLKKWYSGTIVHRNLNGTYNVAYDNVKVDIHNYSESKLYKKIEATNKSKLSSYIEPEHLEPDEVNENEKKEEAIIDEEKDDKKDDWAFLQRAAEAFENFKLFLSDPKVTIDYTYLWDIVCSKNSVLFPNGVNLIILELPEDDSSNNIELVCPTNHYSSDIFDDRKRSIFIIKRENWFEPVFSFRNTGGTQVIGPTFSENDRKLGDIFKKIIKPTLGSKCRTLLNRQKEYRFKQATFLDELIIQLAKDGYTIDNQVLNFQGKVIGLLVTSSTEKQGFVPCYPSSMNSNYDFVYMTDDIWKSYEETIAFLKEYYKYEEVENLEEEMDDKKVVEKGKGKSSRLRADCFKDNSFCRVTDGDYADTVIVGFLTNTNQFIQINKPIPFSSVEDQSIDTISSNDTMIADIKTLTSTNVDNRRIDYIKRINLETNFYNTFRNTIRILFNDYKNSAKRKAIKTECYQKSIMYKEQLKRVVKLLDDLVGDHVEFVEDFDYTDIVEDDIQSCIKNTTDNCTSLCKISKKGDNCVIQFPLHNLVSKQSNKEYYYGRMADELIRYNRIKSFIFKPQAYLSFGEVKYNLKDNEIIVLQDMLTSEFFENMIPFEINRYAKYNTYDNAVPYVRQGTNEVDYNYLLNAEPAQKAVEGVASLEAESSNVELEAPKVELEVPVEKVELEAPKVELEAPKVELEAPVANVVEELEAPVEKVDLEANVVEEIVAVASLEKVVASVCNCIPSQAKPITNATYWKKCFPSSFNEIEYSNCPACPLQLIVDLVKAFKNEDITISQVKDKLKLEYIKLTDKLKSAKKIERLLTILRDENQSFIRDININREDMTFEKMIDLDVFNTVNFDLWLLLNRYEIPSIMISKNDFRQSNNNVMVCWRPESSSVYAIILVPIMNIKKADEFNQYKLITQGDTNNVKINVTELRNPKKPDSECLGKINTAIQQYSTIDNYFDNYVSDTVIKPVILDKLVKYEREFIRKNKSNIIFDVVGEPDDASSGSSIDTAILEIKPKAKKLSRKVVLKGGSKKHTRRLSFSLVV